MQSGSSKIWTCVAVSISYDDNHYTTGTSRFIIAWKLCWNEDKYNSEKEIIEWIS